MNQSAIFVPLLQIFMVNLINGRPLLLFECTFTWNVMHFWWNCILFCHLWLHGWFQFNKVLIVGYIFSDVLNFVYRELWRFVKVCETAKDVPCHYSVVATLHWTINIIQYQCHPPSDFLIVVKSFTVITHHIMCNVICPCCGGSDVSTSFLQFAKCSVNAITAIQGLCDQQSYYR